MVNNEQKTIVFAVNVVDFKDKAKIAVSSTPYYMAVSLWSPNDSITLSKNTFIERQKEEIIFWYLVL